ncbi:hypothetical protein Acr_08g0014500 [Actinidia rufa]|uniref:Uncharacterized protein n=1 Tax=Actinidia rufa TaxID=165716 RepID=A0A7J0F2Z4_9ERIC|nr:hypothetical protein Acr_08g0014500 [Actinidia rufa]
MGFTLRSCEQGFQILGNEVPSWRLKHFLPTQVSGKNLPSFAPHHLLWPSPIGQNGVCWGDLFGLSEGVIHYARHNNCYLEVWVLKKAQWERTRKLSFARMFRQHGRNEYKGLSVKAFHPFDSRRMMFTWHGRPLWFDLESRKADIVSHHPICNQLLYDYFVYEGGFGSSASY